MNNKLTGVKCNEQSLFGECLGCPSNLCDP